MFLRGSHFESFRPIHSDAPTLGSGGLPQVGATDVEDGERHLCGDQVGHQPPGPTKNDGDRW
jgi:hypothetical protein